MKRTGVLFLIVVIFAGSTAAYLWRRHVAWLHGPLTITIDNLRNGQILSGSSELQATVQGRPLNWGDVWLTVDGNSVSSTNGFHDANMKTRIVFRIPTQRFANGKHMICISQSASDGTCRAVVFKNKKTYVAITQ